MGDVEFLVCAFVFKLCVFVSIEKNNFVYLQEKNIIKTYACNMIAIS